MIKVKDTVQIEHATTSWAGELVLVLELLDALVEPPSLNGDAQSLAVDPRMGSSDLAGVAANGRVVGSFQHDDGRPFDVVGAFVLTHPQFLVAEEVLSGDEDACVMSTRVSGVDSSPRDLVLHLVVSFRLAVCDQVEHGVSGEVLSDHRPLLKDIVCPQAHVLGGQMLAKDLAALVEMLPQAGVPPEESQRAILSDDPVLACDDRLLKQIERHVKLGRLSQGSCAVIAIKITDRGHLDLDDPVCLQRWNSHHVT